MLRYPRCEQLCSNIALEVHNGIQQIQGHSSYSSLRLESRNISGCRYSPSTNNKKSENLTGKWIRNPKQSLAWASLDSNTVKRGLVCLYIKWVRGKTYRNGYSYWNLRMRSLRFVYTVGQGPYERSNGHVWNNTAHGEIIWRYLSASSQYVRMIICSSMQRNIQKNHQHGITRQCPTNICTWVLFESNVVEEKYTSLTIVLYVKSTTSIHVINIVMSQVRTYHMEYWLLSPDVFNREEIRPQIRHSFSFNRLGQACSSTSTIMLHICCKLHFDSSRTQALTHLSGLRHVAIAVLVTMHQVPMSNMFLPLTPGVTRSRTY